MSIELGRLDLRLENGSYFSKYILKDFIIITKATIQTAYQSYFT